MKKIVIENLSKSFDDKEIIRNFTYTFEAGSATCIMGPSGIGKTTVLNIIMGLERADSGNVVISDESGDSALADNKSTFACQKNIFGAVFQENRLIEGLSAIDNVRLVINTKEKRSVVIQNIKNDLSMILPPDSLDTDVRFLSGGMKRRVAVARAMNADSDIVLMDEPFAGLDEENKRHVIEYINIKRKDKTLIAVTHDNNDAAALNANICLLTSCDAVAKILGKC